MVADDLDRVIGIDSEYTGRRRDGFYRNRLQAALAEPRGFVYLGFEGGTGLQGFLLARLTEGEYGTPAHSASMDAIGVDPAVRRQGVGKSLMAALGEILKHKGVQTIRSQADWRTLGMLAFFAGTGFTLAPRHVLERDVAHSEDAARDVIEETGGPGALARDDIPSRSMCADDLPAIVKIDRKLTGSGHRAWHERKLIEALGESGIRVSLVAEQDEHVVGFAMARVDFGEFGHVEPAAVLDSIAVDPDYAHHRVGTALLSQLLANLRALHIEVIRLETDAEHFDVLSFLQRNGFSLSQRLAFDRQVR
ncbi:MAG: GNAT family N-acetyltransferase [Woeseia sp.]